MLPLTLLKKLPGHSHKKRLLVLLPFIMGAIILFLSPKSVFAASTLTDKIELKPRIYFPSSVSTTENYAFPSGTPAIVRISARYQVNGQPDSSVEIPVSDKTISVDPASIGDIGIGTVLSFSIVWPDVIDESETKIYHTDKDLVDGGGGGGISGGTLTVDDLHCTKALDEKDPCTIEINAPLLPQNIDLGLQATPTNVFLTADQGIHVSVKPQVKNLGGGLHLELLIPDDAVDLGLSTTQFSVTIDSPCSQVTIPPQVSYAALLPFDFTIPYYPSEDPQPCLGDYKITAKLLYVLKDSTGKQYGVFSEPFSQIVTVKAAGPDSFTTLTVNFFNSQDSSEITPSSTSLVMLTHAPPIFTDNIPTTPSTKIENNSVIVENIFPEYYSITVNPPSGFRGQFQVDSYNLTSAREIDVNFCPSDSFEDKASCLAAGNTEDDCKNKLCNIQTNLENEEEVVEETDIDEKVDICIPEEMLQFKGSWLFRPVFTILCGALDVSAEAAFPLLDVNIPLLKSTSDGTEIVLRKMFHKDIIVQTGKNAIAGVLGELIPESYTPSQIVTMWGIGWAISRTAVILAIVFFAFLIIFRVDVNKYNLKVLLSNLLLGVLLAASSYMLCTLMFDLNRILALIAKDTLTHLFEEGSSGGKTFTDTLGTIVSHIGAGGTVGAAAYFGIPAAIASGPVGIGILLAFLLPCITCLLGYITAIVALFLVLILRMLFLYILVIVAPIAFTLSIIPEFKQITKGWFKSMIGLLSLYPLYTMLYYLLMTIGHIFNP